MSINESNVVVGYDLGPTGRAALKRAIALAKRAPSHVLHFACIAESHTPFPALPARRVDYMYTERVQATVVAEIESELHATEPKPTIQFFVHARIGNPAKEILRLAEEVGADLIIVGSHGARGLERAFLGSVSEQVVREAGCTVEVARTKTYADVERLKIREVTPTGHYVAPHRYFYEDDHVTLRALEWPTP